MSVQNEKAQLSVERVRHPLKARMLTVREVTPLTPYMVRVRLEGDLADFVSASFDDHVKTFFPAQPHDEPVLPRLNTDGPRYPEGVTPPAARDYTPRRFDPHAGRLDIDFVLHDAGPATEWARQAQPGQRLGIAGPRGSFVIPMEFDWHVFIGDESALPAIARRLEELPEGKPVIVVAYVREAKARIDLATRADLRVQWVEYADLTQPEPLLEAVRHLELPVAGEGYVWGAGEYGVMRAVRQYLVETRGIDKSRIRASSYWRQGAVAAHETLKD